MTSPDPMPAAKPGWNTPSLVLGGLGLLAIGALAAVLLTGQRGPAVAPAAESPAAVSATASSAAPPPAVSAETMPAAEASPPAPAAVKSTTAKTRPHPAAKPAPEPVAGTAEPAAAETAPVPGTRTEAVAAPPPPVVVPPPVCTTCGVVASVTPVQQKGEGSGLGAVAGGVLGGVLGHQVGGGRGKDLATVLGAVGGGLAGNEVEKRQRSTTHYDIRVRMDDGSSRTFSQDTSIAVGQAVRIEGNALVVDTTRRP